MSQHHTPNPEGREGFIADMKNRMKNYPSTTLFLFYISVVVTLLFIMQIVRLGHA